MIVDPAWKQYCHALHRECWSASADSFENYVARVLKIADQSYANPMAMGRAGDGGCDGIGGDGDVWYSCYGQRAIIDLDRKLAEKLRTDYQRMRHHQRGINVWRFVTNGPAGPRTVDTMGELRNHEKQLPVPISLQLWDEDRLWAYMLESFGDAQARYEAVLGPLPHSTDVQLSDLLPLIENLRSVTNRLIPRQFDIRSIPENKMDANRLPDVRRLELQQGRSRFAIIDAWYTECGIPEAQDVDGAMFRDLYERVNKTTRDPGEILEHLYVGLVGQNFRMDAKLAAAVFTVTAYFFDRCDIFEHPADVVNVDVSAY